MPARDGYGHGVPSWVDLVTPDLDASARFYRAVFDWTFAPAGGPEQTGGYGFFQQGDRLVAGAAPLSPEQQAQGQPPMWSTYVNVDDVDAAMARATAAGGTVIVQPTDVMTAGRMAFVMDPQGAAVGLWQPGDHKGAQLVNEPNSLCWNEVLTSDPDGAGEFYGAVFGWSTQTQDMGGVDYTVVMVGDDGVGGIMALQPEMAEMGVPPHWSVTFAVADTDAVCEKVKSEGGTVVVEPMDMPIGRMAVVHDPHHVSFQVIALADPPA